MHCCFSVQIGDFMSTFTFVVNYIAATPSKTGEFNVLLNPIGTEPAYQRLENITSVTWEFWLGETKAAEYRKLDADAKAMTQKTGQLHKLFVMADFDVRVKAGFKPGQQKNILKFKTQAVKDIRPHIAAKSNDDLA